nr:hypothetical protein [Tanacetum cinerariifolium]
MSTQEYIRKVIEDDNFTRAPWLTVLDYVNEDGGIVIGCFGDINKFLKNGKLEKVVAVQVLCSECAGRSHSNTQRPFWYNLWYYSLQNAYRGEVVHVQIQEIHSLVDEIDEEGVVNTLVMGLLGLGMRDCCRLVSGGGKGDVGCGVKGVIVGFILSDGGLDMSCCEMASNTEVDE